MQHCCRQQLQHPSPLYSPRCHDPHHFTSRVCVPWWQLAGIGSNQGIAASTMMYGWCTCPWMGQMGADTDSVNAMTSVSMMSSCWKYHGLSVVQLEIPYPTVAEYSFLRETLSPRQSNTTQSPFVTSTMVNNITKYIWVQPKHRSTRGPLFWG